MEVRVKVMWWGALEECLVPANIHNEPRLEFLEIPVLRARINAFSESNRPIQPEVEVATFRLREYSEDGRTTWFYVQTGGPVNPELM